MKTWQKVIGVGMILATSYLSVYLIGKSYGRNAERQYLINKATGPIWSARESESKTAGDTSRFYSRLADDLTGIVKFLEEDYNNFRVYVGQKVQEDGSDKSNNF